jgi:CheY-like chemotaxis protein
VILVVSPDREVRATLAAKASTVGERVEAVSDAVEARHWVDDARKIVLDLATPGLDGDAFADVLAKVVVVGQFHGRPTIIGADRFLKSFNLKRLRAEVGTPTKAIAA